MKRLYHLLAVFLLSSLSSHAQKWSQQDELLGFWPLDEIAKTSDIAAANGDSFELTTSQFAEVMTAVNGPFDEPRTSYTVKADNQSYIVGRRDGLRLNDEFTTSFFFYTKANETGGIFQFFDDEDETALSTILTVTYREPNYLQFSGSDKIPSNFSILKPNTWNFIAFTYNKITKELDVFNQIGNKIASTRLSVSEERKINAFRVGYGEYLENAFFMKTSDAIACLIIHNSTLLPSDIIQLPAICHYKGRWTPQTDWPQRESLLGFWPFDTDSGTRDIQNGFPLLLTGDAKLATKGPFGVPGTSYSVENGESFVGFRNDIALSQEFTIAFYFYTELNQSGSILWFPVLRNEGPTGFAISYLEPKLLEIYGGYDDNATTYSVTPDYKLIGRFSVLTPKKWNFIAITYSEAKQGTIDVFNELGYRLASVQAYVPIAKDNSEDTGMFVGRSSWAYDKESYMKPTDAIACLMVYKNVLTPQEIAKLPGICRAVGAGNATFEQDQPETRRGANQMERIIALPVVFPESLTGFWPFDSKAKLTDLLFYPKQSVVLENEPSFSFTTGPFGEEDAAYKLLQDGSFGHVPFSWCFDGFTLSLFFSTQLKKDGALLMLHSVDLFYGEIKIDLLEFYYRVPNHLDVYWHRETGAHGEIQNQKQIGRFPILKPNAWNFVAITYDRRSRQLRIFDVNGKKLAIAAPANLPIFDNYGKTGNLYIGETRTTSMNMKANDSVSCVMTYSKPLSQLEIMRILHHCLTKGRPPAYSGTWPRTESFLGCWPLDGESNLRDVGYGLPMQNGFAKLVTNLPGPFGLPSSSYSVDGTDPGTADFTMSGERVLYLGRSVTISFYFYTIAQGKGAIFLLHGDFPNVFDISYSEPNSLQLSFPGFSAVIDKIIQTKKWNFLAVSYDHAKQEVGIFDETGTKLWSKPANLTLSLYNFFEVGGNRWTKTYMKQTDAIACLTLYRAALTPSEISQLPQACKTKGRPSTTTAVPKSTTTNQGSSFRCHSNSTITLIACIFSILVYLL